MPPRLPARISALAIILAIRPRRFRHSLAPLRPALIALLCALSLATQAQSGIEELSGAASFANSISSDGSVVVGHLYYGPGSGYRAFRWTQGGGFIDLGSLGGGLESFAYGVSANGAVVVGATHTNTFTHAFRWTSGGGMIDLGTLGSGGSGSSAWGVSANGSVVVGQAASTSGWDYAFRWVQGASADGTESFDTTGTSGGAMFSLGTLAPGGAGDSAARGVSADGAVVVGYAYTGSTTHAFRWTSGGGMVDLGTLGGMGTSNALGVSADGSVVVGSAENGSATHAFRWVQGASADGVTHFDTTGTSGGAMFDLGTLAPDGTAGDSTARGISADGAVVVGSADTGTAARAFRWTQAGGMKSVEDWLRDNGVTVPTDITSGAYATNGDGSIVVGVLANNKAFIARVDPDNSGSGAPGNGLVTLEDVQQSLASTAGGGNMALAATGTLLNGAHSRPLARRVAEGQKTFWLAGDWGRDDHGSRDGDLGLAEAGLGRDFGAIQLNVSFGSTWAKRIQAQNGRAKIDGIYLLTEALIPVSGNLWGVLGGYVQRGKADMRRGYLNAGVQDFSSGRPDADAWGVRGRLEWDKAYRLAGADLSPYMDITRAEAKLDAYTETGGGFPAYFDARKEKATELRLGMNTAKPLDNGMTLFGTLEAIHRFEKKGARTSGRMIGLFGFDLPGQRNERGWLRLGAGMEGKLAEGRASFSLNATTKGEAPNYWLAVGWQRTF